MKWYYDDNKLEQFYNFQKKYYAEIFSCIFEKYYTEKRDKI